MKYIVRREPESDGCLTLYFVAESMASADLNDGGYIDVGRLEEKIAANMERFRSDASNGLLVVTNHDGIVKTLAEIIASIPRDRIEPDSHGRTYSSVELEIYSYLPMLNKWGERYGHTFAFAETDSEVTRIVNDELIRLGRSAIPGITAPDGDVTLQEAANWLSRTDGRSWTDKNVLRRLYDLAESSSCPQSNETLTGAFFTVPKDIVFGSYRGDPQAGGIFRALHTAKTIGLSEEYARALLCDSEVNVAQVIGSYHEDGISVVVEPRGDTFPLTLDMVRLSSDRLMVLAPIEY